MPPRRPGPRRTAGVPGAAAQAQSVAGGQITTVTHALGAQYRPDAVAAFVSGYHLALIVAAVATLAAAAVAAVGLRSGAGAVTSRLGRSRPGPSRRSKGPTPALRHPSAPVRRQPGSVMRRRTRRLPQAPSSVNSPESRAAQYSS